MLEQNANAVAVYQLRFFLKGISPMIWRRLLVTSHTSLADLHYAIQISMGWQDDHLHQFDIWGKGYGLYHTGGICFPDNPRKIFLKDFHFRLHEKFGYEYNFFSHWQHEIRLEKVLPVDPKKTYPLCIGGHYAAPPEDCAGPDTFMRLLGEYSPWDLEEKLSDACEQYQEEHDQECFDETIENLSYWANRHLFNRSKINRQLRRYFADQDSLTIEEVQDED